MTHNGFCMTLVILLRFLMFIFIFVPGGEYNSYNKHKPVFLSSFLASIYNEGLDKIFHFRMGQYSLFGAEYLSELSTCSNTTKCRTGISITDTKAIKSACT